MTKIQDEKHLKLSDFASNLILFTLKASKGMSSTCFTPGLELNYKNCLILDVVSNAQNRALKKEEMDSNPRYGPGHIIKGDKKILQTIDPIHF